MTAEPTCPRELAVKYDRLAWRIAIKHRLRLPAGSDLEDLGQVCRQAVLRAAMHWDPTRGVSFMSYAWRCLTTAANRHIELERRRGLTATGDVTARKLGQPHPGIGVFNEAHVGELAGAGLDNPPALADLAAAGKPGDGDEPRLPPNFWELATRGLNAKQRMALLARYRDGLTLDQAGRQMGLSKERVRQLTVAAVKRIRESGRLDDLLR